MLDLETLMERRDYWINKVGKQVFARTIEWHEKNNIMASYYRTLAFFENQIANQFEDLNEESVKVL